MQIFPNPTKVAVEETFFTYTMHTLPPLVVTMTTGAVCRVSACGHCVRCYGEGGNLSNLFSHSRYLLASTSGDLLLNTTRGSCHQLLIFRITLLSV